MTDPSHDDYRTILLDLLREVGDAAAAMLHDDQPVEPTVLLSAVSAAGLVAHDPADAGAVCQSLSDRSDHPAVAQALHTFDLAAADLRCPEPCGPDEAADRLSRQLDVCGIYHLIPKSTATHVGLFLNEQRSLLQSYPELSVPIDELASTLGQSLDLPEHHPGERLIQAIHEAFTDHLAMALSPLDDDTVDRGIAKARRTLQRRRWAVVLGGVFPTAADDLESVLDRPGNLALAAADGGLPDAVEIARRADESAMILDRGPRLQVAWAGRGTPPTGARLGTMALAPADVEIPGVVAFWLPDDATEQAELVLEFASGAWVLG